MLLSTSGIGLYTPPLLLTYTSPLLGALATRALWLWLGVLDALQGIGFGIILLQTLTRFHVAATLCASQVLGSAMTIAARGSAPNRLGPGEVFPNFALVGVQGLRSVWFWGALGAQVLVCVGFAMVFRGERLFKP
jgi:alpha-1,3-glucan synthase